jgi:ribose/xylose/arabinose/galactoside ABC-type transport system permease subunit
VASWLTGGGDLLPPSDASAFHRLAKPLFGMPFVVYVFAGVALIVALVLRRTRFGAQLYMVGDNRRAARAGGLPVTMVTIGAFAVAGACAAVAGVFLAAVNGNGSLSLAGSETYDAIAAALVGGSAIAGGRGSIERTVVGALVIAAASDLVLLRGYETGFQILVEGMLVLIAVLVGQWRRS